MKMLRPASHHSYRILVVGFLLNLLLSPPLSFLQAQDSTIAWGNNNNTQSTVPAEVTNVVGLAAGTLHSLALRANGTAVGWGDTVFGQANVSAGLSNVAAVAGGSTYSLALLSNGTVVVRGTQPAPPADLTNVTAIAAGWRHCLALRADGTVVSWGDSNAVPANLTNVVAISAGDGQSLALLDNRTVVAWGDGDFGKTLVPPGLSNVVAISAGKDHCLALLQNGTLVGWGRDEDHQAIPPVGLSNIVAVSAGAFHTVALRANGTLAAWGNNIFSQSDVPGWTRFYQIAAGGYHNLGQLGNGSPFINVQPRNLRAPISKTATLPVLAGGVQPLTYQWRRDGTNLVGRTNNILIIPNVQPGDAGDYSVVVANSNGIVTSATAKLLPFYEPPLITAQPQDTNTICGQGAEFTVNAQGYAPLSYQWLFEGAPIDGATATNLALTNVVVSQAGGYSVVITNIAGVVTSAVARLDVTVVPPLITAEPQDRTVICGESASFDVTAESANPLSYQWQFEGMPIPGATSTNLTLTNVTVAMGGGYSVEVMDQCGSVTSRVAILTVDVEAPLITSSLVATGMQGQFFTYSITAMHSPTWYNAGHLPLGLTVDTNTGVISGIPLQSGTLSPLITAYNACASHTETLVVTFASGAPVITSELTATGTEDQALFYQITATGAPFGFAVKNLPEGMTLNTATGLITGQPVYAGEFNSTIIASNVFGTGSALLHFTVTNKPIAALSIANATYAYSSPYLLDFEFSLRDNDDPSQGTAVVVSPRLLTATCVEDASTNSTVEGSYYMGGAAFTTKLIKANLVLDFTQSIASLANGDTNSDGISDAVDQMVEGAKTFINQQSATTQIGVYEFHREDQNPLQVLPLTTDKALLHAAVDSIWDDYVMWFPAASRCWDALTNAIANLGASNRDEQHYVVFISDGRDESSFATVDNVIRAATNNGVKIYCIGFGAELDLTTLTNITTQTSGRYYSATNAIDLAAQFAQVSKDLNGQYVLRWATLKRTSKQFLPKFYITYDQFTAEATNYTYYMDTNNPIINTNNTPPTTNYPYVTNFILAPYTPSQHTGTVTQGSLRLSADAAASPTALTLRASYVPRYIRQLRLHYRANWPCTTRLMSTNTGDLLAGWSLTETNDGSGGSWLLLSSPNPQFQSNGLPFACFGNFVHFEFRDVIQPSNAFSLLELDNTIYTNTGGQRFVIENTNAFMKVYTNLPFGTPAPWLVAHGFSGDLALAELSDPDSDGIPTWQEYLANTDPQDGGSLFVVRGLSNDPYGRYFITFSTAVNRHYRVETSADLINWEIVEDDIPGTGGDVTILDARYIPWIDQVFYRAVIR